MKLKIFRRDDNKEFQLFRNLTNGDTDFNQFLRLRSQLVIAAEDFPGEKNWSPVLTTTMSKAMDEQLKLAHKLVDVMDRANRKISVNLLQYTVDKSECTYAQVQLFAGKKEDEKFQQFAYVKHRLEEFF